MAAITLVASGVIVAAVRTGAAHVAIGQVEVALGAVGLGRRVLLGELGVDVIEDVLSDLGMDRCRGAAEEVEVDVEPLIDLRVYLVVLVADLLRCHSLLDCLHLRCRPVFISSADVDRIVPSETTIPRVDISTQYASNQVPQMWYVVHVGQSTGNQDVSSVNFWQRNLTLPNPLDLQRVKLLQIVLAQLFHLLLLCFLRSTLWLRLLLFLLSLLLLNLLLWFLLLLLLLARFLLLLPLYGIRELLFKRINNGIDFQARRFHPLGELVELLEVLHRLLDLEVC